MGKGLIRYFKVPTPINPVRKFISKGIKIFLVLVLVCILSAAFFRHRLCRILIEKAALRTTGLKLSIEKLNLDILSSSLYIRGAALFNPPGFRSEILCGIKEILIKYDLVSFLSGRTRLHYAKADISEINIIRDKEGNSNLSVFSEGALRRRFPEQAAAVSVAPKKSPKKKEKEYPKFFIDNLELFLEKAVFTDYKAGIDQPAVIIFTIRAPYLFKNVSKLNCVVDLILAEGGFRDLTEKKEEKKQSRKEEDYANFGK